ncbi:uncharacterized protein VTP21DRAFT_1819 [Calcarisporiella thermophila]|uniref:uncharacterized protein n=1 Tax=Calcarisporiella thermophila TaxID=911321 RepID=UPI0037446FDE
MTDSDGFLVMSLTVPYQDKLLPGELHLPPDEKAGICVFVHGSGSSRFSSRNRYIAEMLRKAGVGTFLMDLLTPDEEYVDMVTRHLRFDLEMLAGRVVAVIDYFTRIHEGTRSKRIALFGASTGAGAAFIAANARPDKVHLVMARGGRADLVPPHLLHATRCPSLLMVGANDTHVLHLNQQAFADLGSKEKKLEVIPGASHLFEEEIFPQNEAYNTGTLEKIAELASEWAKRYLLSPE